MEFPLHFGLQKIGLPLIMIDFQGANLCILLDTGANINYIDKKVYDYFKDNFELLPSKGYSFGIDGVRIENENVRFDFIFENETYCTDFQVSNGNGFDNILKDEGIQIDGVLGSNFFVEHKWIIDYSELKVYCK